MLLSRITRRPVTIASLGVVVLLLAVAAASIQLLNKQPSRLDYQKTKADLAAYDKTRNSYSEKMKTVGLGISIHPDTDLSGAIKSLDSARTSAKMLGTEPSIKRDKQAGKLYGAFYTKEDSLLASLETFMDSKKLYIDKLAYQCRYNVSVSEGPANVHAKLAPCRTAVDSINVTDFKDPDYKAYVMTLKKITDQIDNAAIANDVNETTQQLRNARTEPVPDTPHLEKVLKQIPNTEFTALSTYIEAHAK